MSTLISLDVSKIKGDYYKYLAELKSSNDKKEDVDAKNTIFQNATLCEKGDYYKYLAELKSSNDKKEVLNNRRKDEDMDTELTRTDIVICVQSDKVKLRGVNLFGLDISKLTSDLTNANLEGANLEGADLKRQFWGITGDLSPGIGFSGDMSPGIHRTEKLKWDPFPGDIPGRHRRAHIVSVKQLSATVEGFPGRHIAREPTIN
nr:hypothetical protein [Tanacetum cinerariifolium]